MVKVTVYDVMKEAVLHPYGTTIHPRSVEGRFRRLKNLVLLLAYAVYFGLPWLPWARAAGPDQAILFDLADRKFYLFGLVMQPEQVFWLAGVLVIAAVALFFVTGLAGRVFCGYFCFQTIWTDIFHQIEHWIQGERPARIRLDKQPWNIDKIRKKGLTWTLYFVVALSTGISFTLYWGEAGDLLLRFFIGEAPAAMYICVLVLTTSTFVMAGFAREAVCLHMCPYSRFQSAMVDTDTRIVAYDKVRGERSKGRAKPERDQNQHLAREQAGKGDCVDCGYCVQVCPTGIDIREGMQIGCINCGLCIDACDNIMSQLGWPKGLIRYSSEKEDAGAKSIFLTAKNIGYGLTLLMTTFALVYSMATKAPLETSVYQIRNPLYVEFSDGRIRNSYEIKLRNQTDKPQTWKLSLKGLEHSQMKMGQLSDLTVGPLQFLTIYVTINQNPDQENGGTPQVFQFLATPVGTSDDLRPVAMNASFYSP